MDILCPQCRTPFHRPGPSQAVLQCRACSLVWLHRETLRRFVRDAINAAGVPKKVIGLTETPGIAADVSCPTCAATLQSTQLRGVAALQCLTCDHVLAGEVELRNIVQRVIEAETGWKAAEAEWSELYATMKLNAARYRESAASAETTGFLLGVLAR